MNEDPSDVHVRDNRMFNADGSIREDSTDPSLNPRTEPQKNTTTPKAAPPNQQPREVPAGNDSIDFPTFILSLASSVQISLGIVPNPMTGTTECDINHAKQTIDIIGMLEEKTVGNLTPEESGLLKQILFQLRMQFVEVSKKSK